MPGSRKSGTNVIEDVAEGRGTSLFSLRIVKSWIFFFQFYITKFVAIYQSVVKRELCVMFEFD